jgi:hypothetical protein
MLKRALIFLVAFCLFVQSTAYVPPTYAASTSVRLTHISAGVSGGATREFIALMNMSPDAVDITGWCLVNKSSISFACFEPQSPAEVYVLPPGEAASIVSMPLAQTLPDGDFSLVYQPTSASSGSLVGSSESLRLVDGQGDTVDSHAWTTPLPSSQMYLRGDDEVGLWRAVAPVAIPQNGVVIETIDIEEPLPLPPPEAPILPTLPTLNISELLPNAIGSDSAAEFIELENYGTEPIDILQLRLVLGVSSLKEVFLEGLPIEPGEYRVILNSLFSFSLVNTTGRVQLLTGSGSLVAESAIYESPKEGESWALINEVWQYTNRPTPGAANEPSDVVTGLPKLETSSLKPCTANQYRSPETNRCRNIEVPTPPTPCLAGHFRSPETNRCRKSAVEPAAQPCQPGQERNSETNRCRTIKKLDTANYAVLGATSEEQPNQWYIFAAIAAAVLAVVGYAIFEWRREIAGLFKKLWQFVRRRF